MDCQLLEEIGDMIMNNTFARDYVQSLIGGKKTPLRIAFLGGSITKGEFVDKELGFVSVFSKQIKQVLDCDTQVFCYGQSGITSANALYRLPEVMADNPDLVFIDFAVNDPGERYLWESTEGLAYQFLKKGIGVVFLFFCNERGTCTRGAMERVGRYYEIPVYDIGKYLYEKVQTGEIAWQEYAMDYVHPTVWGHSFIAEQLLKLFTTTDRKKTDVMFSLPSEPCFAGAFRKTRIWELESECREKQVGDIIFDGEIDAKMILVETWQYSTPNEASIVFSFDGNVVYCAEAYASMAWGNPICRYIGGDGTLEKHHLTVTLGKGVPPKGWKYSELKLRFLIGE